MTGSPAPTRRDRASGSLRTTRPGRGSAPSSPESPPAAPKRDASGKSTCQARTRGSATGRPPGRLIAAACVASAVSTPSTSGSAASAPSRSTAARPAGPGGVITRSSTGPSVRYASWRTEKFRVSPTTRAPTMMAVPSTDPLITRAASVLRRAIWRKASRRETGCLTATSSRAARDAARMTSRGARRAGYMVSPWVGRPWCRTGRRAGGRRRPAGRRAYGSAGGRGRRWRCRG